MSHVATFLARRVAGGVIVVFFTTVVAWLLVNALGNPARLMLPFGTPQSEVNSFSKQMGFDRPVLTRIWSFFSQAVRGNFGTSYWQNRPALGVVMQRVPAELELIMCAMAVAYFGSLLLGTLAAARPNGTLDRLITWFSAITISMPAYWLGELLVVVFAVKLKLFPVIATGDSALILPALALAALPFGRLTQVVRSAVLDERTGTHVTALRSRGITELRILFIHTVRNASAAIVTMGGWEIGRLLAGFTVTVEVVFGWPGLGLLAVQAVQQHDVPLVVADVFVVSTTLVILNIVVDGVRFALDRRVSI